MNDLWAMIFPELAKGAGAGLVAWFLLRVEMIFLRRDVDGLRYIVYMAQNPKNLIGITEALRHRVKHLEVIEGITYHD